MREGWQTRKLGEVCSLLNRGISPVYLKEGGICVLNQKCIRNHEINTELARRHDDETKKVGGERFVRVGDVLINSTGTGTLGRVAQVRSRLEEATTVDSHVTIVRPKAGMFHLDFFGYMLVAIEEAIKEAGEGCGGQTELARSVLADRFYVCYPESLLEQQRIVALLDEALAGLATAKAHAERNLQNARALFESHLQSVFTQRGPGWVEKRLGEVGKVSMCKRIFKEETTTTGDIPFYKIGTFGKEPDAFIPIQTYNEYRTKYSFPKKGDVLISASGTIGRRVRYDGEPAYFQDSNIVWIDNDEERVLNDFLYHFYGACKWNSTKGATISRLYNDNLRGIVIAFPESHQEQRLIVTQLDDLHEETQSLARLYERKCAALEALKKSLLHQAFSGEL
jgi:type I restriction enzyme S subunit